METTSDQRVFGLGGAGGRIADTVARATAGHLPATVVDCDLGSLGALRACQYFVLGQNSSRFGGRGSGGDAAAVRMAAEEQAGELSALLDGVSLAVVVAGLGGGVGSGLLPAFLDLAAERNVRTLVFAVTPFAMEGPDRLRAAGAALSNQELAGFTVWQLTDCRSFHRDGGAVRCKPFAENLAGIYDGYRRPKLPVVAAVRDAFRSLP